jgi:hypothetical protein
MIKEIRNYMEKTAADIVEWFFHNEIKQFDELANELKQLHDSPSSYDIKTQIANIKEHLHGYKIPVPVDLDFNDTSEIEAAGLPNNYDQTEVN